MKTLNDFGLYNPLSLHLGYKHRAIVVALKPQEKNMVEEEKKGNKPVHEERAGAIKASVWAKEITKDDKKWTNYTTSVQRGYKDKEGEWQNTNTLNAADIPKAVVCLNKAYEWIITQKKGESKE